MSILTQLDAIRGDRSVLEFGRRFTHAAESCSFDEFPEWTGAEPRKHEMRVAIVEQSGERIADVRYYIDGLRVSREDFETLSRWVWRS